MGLVRFSCFHLDQFEAIVAQKYNLCRKQVLGWVNSGSGGNWDFYLQSQVGTNEVDVAMSIVGDWF